MYSRLRLSCKRSRASYAFLRDGIGSQRGSPKAINPKLSSSTSISRSAVGDCATNAFPIIADNVIEPKNSVSNGNKLTSHITGPTLDSVTFLGEACCSHVVSFPSSSASANVTNVPMCRWVFAIAVRTISPNQGSCNRHFATHASSSSEALIYAS